MVTTAAVLMNPEAGKGKGRKTGPALAAALRRRGIDSAVLVGTDAEHGLALAEQAVADGVDCLIAAGGDGTVNLALQAVAGTSTPLGLVAVGTGNDIAATLGLPVGDVAAAVDVIAQGNARTIDLGRVATADGQHRWFLGVLSAGFDSDVTEKANQMKWPKGQARYLVATVAMLRSFVPVRFDVDIDGEHLSDDSMLVSIGNGARYGGGMQICAGAKVDDGLLTATWLHKVGTAELLRTFPKIFSGTHVRHPKVTQHTGRHFHVEAAGQICYADGERVGLLPIDVDVQPGALRVLLPAGSMTGSPVDRD